MEEKINFLQKNQPIFNIFIEENTEVSVEIIMISNRTMRFERTAPTIILILFIFCSSQFR